MEKTNLWNDAAKYGAVVGALLIVSSICEMYLLMDGRFTIMALEWLMVVVAHYYLLHRFVKQRSRQFGQAEGFNFGQAYTYLLSISLFSGIWMGLGSYLYLHFVVGYSRYADRVIEVMSNMMQQMGIAIPASVADQFTALQNTPEPSILNSVGSGAMSGLLFGALFGLIIAGVLSRDPKPFDDSNN